MPLRIYSQKKKFITFVISVHRYVSLSAHPSVSVYQLFFHICLPGVFLLTHIISLLSVIHTIYNIMQTKIQGLHVSTVYVHLQALFLNQSKSYLKYISRALGSHALTLRLIRKYICI